MPDSGGISCTQQEGTLPVRGWKGLALTGSLKALSDSHACYSLTMPAAPEGMLRRQGWSTQEVQQHPRSSPQLPHLHNPLVYCTCATGLLYLCCQLSQRNDSELSPSCRWSMREEWRASGIESVLLVLKGGYWLSALHAREFKPCLIFLLGHRAWSGFETGTYLWRDCFQGRRRCMPVLSQWGSYGGIQRWSLQLALTDPEMFCLCKKEACLVIDNLEHAPTELIQKTCCSTHAAWSRCIACRKCIICLPKTEHLSLSRARMDRLLCAQHDKKQTSERFLAWFSSVR